MDDADVSPEVIEAEYRFLSKFNRATMAAASLLREIDTRVHPTAGTVSVVDMGSGGGDIPRDLLRHAKARAWKCTCLCTDSSDRAVEYARGQERMEGLSFRVVDALDALGALGARSADVVHSSLMLHHFETQSVVRALRSMSAVARQLVVWNDLVRDRAGVLGAYLSTLLSRRELHRDAVVSVRRSFTLDEARALAIAAGLKDVSVRRVCGARFVLSGLPGDGGGDP